MGASFGVGRNGFLAAAPLYGKFHKKFAFSNTKGYDLFQMFRTFWLMGFIRVLDVYRDVPLTFRQAGSIFTTANWGALFDGSFLKLGLSGADLIVAGLGAIAMLLVSIAKNKGDVRERLITKPAVLRYGVIVILILLIAVFGAYGLGYDAGQFIYVQF